MVPTLRAKIALRMVHPGLVLGLAEEKQMVDSAVTPGNGGGGDRVIIRGQYLQLGS